MNELPGWVPLVADHPGGNPLEIGRHCA